MKILFSIVLCALPFLSSGQEKDLIGAWELKDSKTTCVITYVPGFFSVAFFNTSDKQFMGTYGGKYVVNKDEVTETIEYDSQMPEVVGSVRKLKMEVNKQTLTLTGATKGKFTRVDDGTPGKLAGAWVITGRLRDNQLQPMTPGARRTVKILSGTRFQWIAYNVETKELFGTGGGTYTTIDGKYTEYIEFFPKDASRVGASLTFEFSFLDGNWRHKGKSSKGEPLDEVWTLREKLGI
jgi:hypothetical protein